MNDELRDEIAMTVAAWYGRNTQAKTLPSSLRLSEEILPIIARERAAAKADNQQPNDDDHLCESCPDCLHDGGKCCGCYDSACCRESHPNAEVQRLRDENLNQKTTLDYDVDYIRDLETRLRNEKAAAWEDGYDSGVNDLANSPTPSGMSIDPERNPYRTEATK